MLDMCSVQDAAHLIISSDIHMELQIMPAHNFTTRPGFGNCLTTDSVVVCDMGTMPPSRHASTGQSLCLQQHIVLSVICYYSFSSNQ